MEESKQEALDMVRRLTEDYPHSAEALCVRGSTLYLYGRSAEAVQWWGKCLEQDPNRADAWRMLGIVAFKKNQYDEAVRMLGKAEEIDPSRSDIHEDLASVYLDMGKPELAAAALEGSSGNSSRRSNPSLLLAEVHFQLQEYEKAKEHYLAAIEVKASSVPAYYGLANVYAKLRQRDKAAECLEKFKQLEAEERQANLEVTKTWPRLLAKAHTDAGRVYYRLGDRQKAEHHWQRASDADAENRLCREQLFNLHVANQRWGEAVELTRQLRQIAPDNAEYHRMAGELLTRLKQFPAAEEALDRAVELAPDDPAGYRSLAVLLLRQRERVQEAKALCQKLIEMEQAAENYYILAEARDKTGDSAGALAAIKAAVDLDPNNQRYRQIHKMLQAKQ